jgi:hypothetical protein
LRRSPRSSPLPLLLIATLAAAALAGCPRRGGVHLGRADGGSSVVMVDRGEATLQRDAGAALPTIEEREPNNTLAEAQPLLPGQAVRGHMNTSTAKRGDVDVYRIVIAPTGAGTPGAAPAPPPPPPVAPRAPGSQPLGAPPAPPRPSPERSLVTVRLTGVPGLDLTLDVLDERGEVLCSVNDGRAGLGEVIPNLGLQPGTYHVRVRQPGKTVGADETNAYVLSVTTAPLGPGEEIEPNDKAAWATELLPGTDVTGYFGWRRDEDWFRVPLTAAPDGATLRVDLQGVSTVNASVTVYDSIKTKLLEAKGGRGDRVSLRAVALKKGEPAMYVMVRADVGKSTEERYSLRVALDLPGEPTELEPNDGYGQATPLDGAQGALAGYIASTGDVDWYRLTAATPSLARVEVSCPERVDLKIGVHDATGKELWRVDEGGRREPETVVNVPVRGTVLLRVYARPGDVNADEPYRLSWKVDPDDGTWEHEPNNSFAAATPWPAGATVMRGYLHPRGDVDTFKVVAPADRPAKLRAAVHPLPRVRISLVLLEAADPGSTLKPTQVAETKPATEDADRVLEAPLAAGKIYYLQLRDGSGKSSNPRDSYSLTVTIE